MIATLKVQLADLKPFEHLMHSVGGFVAAFEHLSSEERAALPLTIRFAASEILGAAEELKKKADK